MLPPRPAVPTPQPARKPRTRQPRCTARSAPPHAPRATRAAAPASHRPQRHDPFPRHAAAGAATTKIPPRVSPRRAARSATSVTSRTPRPARRKPHPRALGPAPHPATAARRTRGIPRRLHHLAGRAAGATRPASGARTRAAPPTGAVAARRCRHARRGPPPARPGAGRGRRTRPGSAPTRSARRPRCPQQAAATRRATRPATRSRSR